jgi:hypothetical protein
MAYVREGINAHVREMIERELLSSFIQFQPILYFLGLANQERAQNLGTPNTPAVFGGANMTPNQIEQTLGSMGHHFRYQKSEPNDGDNLTFGGVTPVASSNADEDMGTSETRWTHIQEPLRINKHAMEMARGESAIGALVDESMSTRWNRFIKRIAVGIWNGTMTAAQQNDNLWSTFLGLTHSLTANNTYGRVDRAVETELNPLVLNAATQLPSTVINLDINRKVNVGFRDTLGATISGLAQKSPNGMGANLFVTTPALWNELADQADGRTNIVHSGIEGHFASGFRFPIIEHDNVWYTWDPNCPAGVLVGLNLDTWVLEVQQGHNFIFTGFTDKSRTEEGGQYYEWGAFDAMLRLTSRAPYLNCRITGLTTT